MSDKKLEVIIVILVLLVVAIGGYLYYTVINKNEEYTKLEKEITRKKEEENKDSNEKNTINDIEGTKAYNTIIKKVIDKDVYIEVETNGSKTIKNRKGNEIYYLTGNIAKIDTEGKEYVLDNNNKTVTINKKNSNDSESLISFINEDLSSYENIEIKTGEEEYKEENYYFELIGDTKYYFNNEKLEYVIYEGETIKIINISVSDDTLFEIPNDYTIIDNTIKQ